MHTENTAAQEPEKLINRQELRRRIPLSETTVWRWEQEGILKPVRIAGRPFYRETDIAELVANGRPRAPHAA